MAMTADSPRAAADSPRKSKNLSSPWAKVVLGQSESIPAVNQSSEQSSSPSKSALSPWLADNVAATDNSETNVGKGKKAAWNKPSNELAEVGPVMGAISWPALSESTKASPKSLPAESSLKISSDGSMPSSQGPGTPHSPHKQATSNAKSSSTTNHPMPARQRFLKRNSGGGSGSSGGGSNTGGGHLQNNFTHPSTSPPPPPPPYPVFMYPNGYARLPVMPDHSPREPLNRANNWEARPGVFVGNNHRHSSQRGNFGPHGDGPYQNNFGGRRDQDRGHYGSARDVHVQPQRASPRGFVRHPQLNNGPFVPPQPVRPFTNPIGFPHPDMLYYPQLPMEVFPGVPFIGGAPSMFMPVPEPSLPAMLLYQIEYYFSNANLVKDNFLKSNMDDQGWVPIALIASFNRVKNMTHDTQLILESLRTSTLLEVQDNKVRRRNDWAKWIPGSSWFTSDSGPQSSSLSSPDMLTTSFQRITVEETAPNQNGLIVESSSNSDNVSRLTDQAQISHISHCEEDTEDLS